MHHTYLYFGSTDLLPALAAHARKIFNFPDLHSPDVRILSYEKFVIEESRALRESAQMRSVSGRSLFIIAAASMTSEAQQALLKLFEEPQESTIFVLLVPHGMIIPTLRSRMTTYIYQGLTLIDISRLNLAKTFLAMTHTARSAEIAKMLKNEENARERVRDFINALEQALHTALTKSKGKKEFREGLEDIANVRSYLSDRSPSLKMLLEHLALALPILK